MRTSHVKFKLELIVEKDIYNLIDTSITGGVSIISTWHAKANNQSLPSYDPELPCRDLIYLNANNLMGMRCRSTSALEGFAF